MESFCAPRGGQVTDGGLRPLRTDFESAAGLGALGAVVDVVAASVHNATRAARVPLRDPQAPPSPLPSSPQRPSLSERAPPRIALQYEYLLTVR